MAFEESRRAGIWGLFSCSRLDVVSSITYFEISMEGFSDHRLFLVNPLDLSSMFFRFHWDIVSFECPYFTSKYAGFLFFGFAGKPHVRVYFRIEAQDSLILPAIFKAKNEKANQ
jgi:hypothetical protein